MIITTTERARASHHRAHSRSALEPGLETYLVRLIRRLLEKQQKRLINAIVIASNTSARLFNVLATPRSRGLMQLIRISLPLRVGDLRTSSRRQLKLGDLYVSSTERKKNTRNHSLTHFCLRHVCKDFDAVFTWTEQNAPEYARVTAHG